MSREGMDARLRELERRIVELRRELSCERESFPKEPAHYLEVYVGEGRYLLPVAPVVEVLPMVWPAPLPEAPAWVRGTMRYGERVVPMIDLERRLYGVARLPTPEQVVVLVAEPTWVGLVARGVVRVQRLAPLDFDALAPGVPQAPFLVATRSTEDLETAHLLSISRISRELLVDDDR
ncbi:MAG: chemotaxis protein CheW [Myxococcales bacterium]|nr:chemotaxis protein CheW [Myxococcales bacterium]